MQNEQFPRRHFYVPFGEFVHLHMQYCSFANSILKCCGISILYTCRETNGQFLFEIPKPDMFLQNFIDHFKKFQGSVFCFVLSCINLLGTDTVFSPVASAIAVIEHQRLQIVHRMCKS